MWRKPKPIPKPKPKHHGRLWCVHHSCVTRLVGKPGSDEERLQCPHCEIEFWQAVDHLLSKEDVV